MEVGIGVGIGVGVEDIKYLDAKPFGRFVTRARAEWTRLSSALPINMKLEMKMELK